MITDLNFAPISILAFLGSCAALVLGLAILLHPAMGRNPKRRRIVLGTLAGGIGVYAGLLVGLSLISQERALARGVEKHFCEVDCHLAYSVVDVQRASVPPGDSQTAAPSTYYVVTLRTRFDETTISPRRRNGILHPNPREVFVVDDRGNQYEPLPAAKVSLPRAIQSTPLTQALRPGESCTTTLVFNLPSDVQSPRLMVLNHGWPNFLLIGHENSPLHKKAYFAL